ncbi:MAG: glycosyltransferase family 2 protein [Actinomycetia bacterium]|nr:glycosyltransferase family 2 protein [Actinomycetes bacterium]
MAATSPLYELGGLTLSSAPRVTIGLPVYNGENYLSESIAALLGQTYENFELLISDNASTDSTPEICREYAKQDGRIRYIRQPRNIGLIPNENFTIREARGELVKLAAHDDLYARDLLKVCVEALDAHPEAVVAHCRETRIDSAGTIVEALGYSVKADEPYAPERFRSMLFDGWDDYTYGVMRKQVLMRTKLCGSHHLADRTFNVELSLHGPFCLVPEWMYFRRASERAEAYTVRSRCVYSDPRRASRLRHPVARLYGEYIWGYISAILAAPLTPAERRECFGHLARWLAGRAAPVAERIVRRASLQDTAAVLPALPDVNVDAVVAGRERAAS